MMGDESYIHDRDAYRLRVRRGIEDANDRKRLMGDRYPKGTLPKGFGPPPVTPTVESVPSSSSRGGLRVKHLLFLGVASVIILSVMAATYNPNSMIYESESRGITSDQSVGISTEPRQSSLSPSGIGTVDYSLNGLAAKYPNGSSMANAVRSGEVSYNKLPLTAQEMAVNGGYVP